MPNQIKFKQGLLKEFTKFAGFTLVEVLVGIAVFLLIATASYQAYISLFTLINLNQYKITALNLVNEQFEIIRNLPYADVGVQGSIPKGKIPHTQTLTRSGVTFVVTATIRNVDLPFDGTIGGSPNDLSPSDNKIVEIQVDCASCKSYTPLNLTTTVAPKNLETASTNGALFIRVFDANGIAIPDASVHIVNNKVNPAITIDDVTDVNGMLQIVDVPPGTNAYEITVSKNGYSSDRTYTPGTLENPDPTQPHANVLIQQVTQISFVIDRLSTLSFSSVTPTCQAVPNIDFNLTGAKTIGTNIPKYSQNLITNSSGVYSNSAIEWDTYQVLVNDADYNIIGLNPLNPILLNPNSSQNVRLILQPKDPNTLLVTIKDSATNLPLTDAIIKVTGPASFNETKISGRGFINQTNWSGGPNQTLYTDLIKYFFDDGSTEIASPTGEIKLKNVFGAYNPSAVLESSTIDTGSVSNFYNLTWGPVDQPVLAGPESVKFQFASNDSDPATTTWEYVGPDGATTTYYTSSNTSLSSIHNGDRYARYKVFLKTDSTTVTPNISDVAFTVTSSCTPPGQVVFSGLPLGTYHVEVGKSGYATSTLDVDLNVPWKEQEMILNQ